jgi:RNA polymerase sigma factor (sigma-70 family)
MAARPEHLLQHFCRLASGREPEPDAVLLGRFVHQHDEAAFAELVSRHGAMVLGVCRRVLHDEHQAEDALQATFLLLAKKAATVRPTASLAAWLHTVARHLALKCRRTEEPRRLREIVRAQSPGIPPPRDPLDELTARELLHILDEEIQRLSESYRLPLILCVLEGLSVEEAARRLTWAPGSVRGRLARGRARLHARLARRGVVLPAGAIAALLAPRTAEAALSALAVKALADGSGVPDRVAALVEGVLGSLKGAKFKIGLALLLTAAVAVGAGGLTYQTPPAEQPAANRATKTEKGKSSRRSAPIATATRCPPARWRGWGRFAFAWADCSSPVPTRPTERPWLRAAKTSFAFSTPPENRLANSVLEATSPAWSIRLMARRL